MYAQMTAGPLEEVLDILSGSVRYNQTVVPMNLDQALRESGACLPVRDVCGYYTRHTQHTRTHAHARARTHAHLSRTHRPGRYHAADI